MPAAPLRLLHVSDFHILAEEGRLQHGADTGAILRTAVPLMQALRPDAVLAGGDLVSDGSEAAYRRLRSLLRPLEAPVHFVLGNHDDRAAFRRVFRPAEAATAAPLSQSFERGGLRFILLDTGLPGKEEGRLDGGQLRWLEAELSAHPAEPTWLVLHHHPLPIYIRWLDALGLQDAEPFLEIVRRFPQVTTVAYGHVHQVRRFRYGGVLFLGVPALAFQFSSHSQEPLMTLETPGFRRIEVAAGEQRSWLHFLDGRVVPEPALPAVPVYVR